MTVRPDATYVGVHLQRSVVAAVRVKSSAASIKNPFQSTIIICLITDNYNFVPERLISAQLYRELLTVTNGSS